MYPYRPSEYRPRNPGLPVEGVSADGPRTVDEFDPLSRMPFSHPGERVVVRVCCGTCGVLVATTTASAGGLLYAAKVMLRAHAAPGSPPPRPQLVDVELDLLDAGHATLLGGKLAAWCRRHGTIEITRAEMNAAVEAFRREQRTQTLRPRPARP